MSNVFDDAPDEVKAAQGSDSPAALIVYCRSWCPDCRRAKAWLDQNGIAYTEVDVESDPDARDRAAGFNEGRLHTPTFEIGDDICVDFRIERLKELLDMM
ncbi:MAG TPA: glutaredoxin family protein [Coriobacteriia bacterium]|nr:glutaredoxin family protein [Coriobacteriia bacterium]